MSSLAKPLALILLILPTLTRAQSTDPNPHPRIAQNGAWAGTVAEAILVLFALAVLAGFATRQDR